MPKTKITIVPTSNETILKFEADRFLTNHNSFEFNNIDEAKDSPLAQQLFYLPYFLFHFCTSCPSRLFYSIHF